MSAQTVTIISGVVLLVVFVLVAWTQRHRRGRGTQHRVHKTMAAHERE